MVLANLWDLTWRAAAIRVAVKRHQVRWAISLATVSSMGTLPMFYLWRQRAAAQMRGEEVKRRATDGSRT